MKIVKRISLLFFLTALIPCQAMEVEPNEEKRFKITPEMLERFEKTFADFAKELEEVKFPQLQRLPDPNTWLGWAAMGTINLVMKNFTRFAEVRPEETKNVLGRAFHREGTKSEAYELPPLLREGLDKLKTVEHTDYRNYMSEVLSALTEDDLEKRKLDRLAELMEEKKKKYTMPTARDIANTDFPDSDLACLITASLFTTCCVEERLLLEKKDKVSRHPHSPKAKKRLSIEA
ncbi:hypothetical protein E3J61_01360 [Candidatus Dependentiae bacterium]|nr:MAG: hypothetical protein E3J61_01360 [Candidatus Dependentiae bacterium]